jgi:hypothetical protein
MSTSAPRVYIAAFRKLAGKDLLAVPRRMSRLLYPQEAGEASTAAILSTPRRREARTCLSLRCMALVRLLSLSLDFLVSVATGFVTPSKGRMRTISCMVICYDPEAVDDI